MFQMSWVWISAPKVYWVDIFHIYLLYELAFLFEKMKINEKDAEDGPHLKKQLFSLDLLFWMRNFKEPSNQIHAITFSINTVKIIKSLWMD